MALSQSTLATIVRDRDMVRAIARRLAALGLPGAALLAESLAGELSRILRSEDDTTKVDP